MSAYVCLCLLYKVAVYGGSIEVDGTTMENDSAGFGTQTGFDVYCEAPQDAASYAVFARESHKLAAGNPILVEHSRTIFQAAQWYSAGGSQSMAGALHGLCARFSRAPNKVGMGSTIKSKRVAIRRAWINVSHCGRQFDHDQQLHGELGR
jgi:hypothetical protein